MEKEVSCYADSVIGQVSLFNQHNHRTTRTAFLTYQHGTTLDEGRTRPMSIEKGQLASMRRSGR